MFQFCRLYNDWIAFDAFAVVANAEIKHHIILPTLICLYVNCFDLFQSVCDPEPGNLVVPSKYDSSNFNLLNNNRSINSTDNLNLCKAPAVSIGFVYLYSGLPNLLSSNDGLFWKFIICPHWSVSWTGPIFIALLNGKQICVLTVAEKFA